MFLQRTRGIGVMTTAQAGSHGRGRPDGTRLQCGA